jgi:hypothetical protein
LPERFADIATAMAKILGTPAGTTKVGIATPENLTGLMPFVRVTRSGGPRDRVSDYARIAVDVFDSDYTRGQAMAETVARYLEPGRLRFGAVLIDRVVCDIAPREVAPWAPGIFRWEATYTVVSRRYRTA